MEPKFIIATTDHYTGYFKFGLVDLHSDLKCKNEAVYGGGKCLRFLLILWDTRLHTLIHMILTQSTVEKL